MISPLASFSFRPTGPFFCLKFRTVVGVEAVSVFNIPDGNDMQI